MKKTLLLLALLSSFVMGCGPNSDSGDIPRTKIRVGIAAEGIHHKLRTISNEYEDTTYDIEWVEFETSKATIEALAAGAVDIVPQTQYPSVITAQGNAGTVWTKENAPFLIVAAWQAENEPGFALVVRDPQISSPSDLQGKSVAYSPGSLGQVYWESLKSEFQLTSATPVQLAPPEGRAALAGGSVDALITVYRSALNLQDKGLGVIIDNSSRVVENYRVSLVAPDVLRDPAVTASIEDFLKRVQRANTWILENINLVAEQLVSDLDMDPASAVEVAPYDSYLRVPLTQQAKVDLQKVADLFYSAGIIKRDIDIQVLLDQTFEK